MFCRRSLSLAWGRFIDKACADRRSDEGCWSSIQLSRKPGNSRVCSAFWMRRTSTQASQPHRSPREEFIRRKEMRLSRSFRLVALLGAAAVCLSAAVMFAQETTGGLQGTVKDASGAVVGGAHVVVRGTTMAG